MIQKLYIFYYFNSLLVSSLSLVLLRQEGQVAVCVENTELVLMPIKQTTGEFVRNTET